MRRVVNIVFALVVLGWIIAGVYVAFHRDQVNGNQSLTVLVTATACIGLLWQEYRRGGREHTRDGA